MRHPCKVFSGPAGLLRFSLARGASARADVRKALRRLCGAALLVAGCTWQPAARPVQPEQVFAGAARVDQQLGRDGRYALVQVGTVTPGSEAAASLPPGSGELKHYRLVDTQNLAYCALPPDFAPAGPALAAPNLRGDGVAALWLPIRVGDAASAQGAALYFTDEKCNVKGPVGKVGRVSALALRADARDVALTLFAGDLTLVDPWTDTQRPIAREVANFAVVDTDNTVSAEARPPEALWLLEGPHLTQRALDGTLLLSLGQQRVEEFVQQRYADGLRVAFVDGADLFEAKGPSFTPVLVANGACTPAYRNTSLELFFPCSTKQLVRVDLLSGAVRRFPDGVSESFTLGELEFQRGTDPSGKLQGFVALKSGDRIPVVPVPLGVPSLLGTTQVVGVAEDGRFGAWSLRGGFVQVLSNVRELRPFRSTRSNELEWLVLYDVQNNLGRIGTFTQRDVERALVDPSTPLAVNVLAEGVPRSNGYRVSSGLSNEPVVLTLENATRMADQRYAGTLHARLLSGSLEARIDDGVSSNLLLIAPQPAVLYGISEGERSGLWFAAL